MWYTKNVIVLCKNPRRCGDVVLDTASNTQSTQSEILRRSIHEKSGTRRNVLSQNVALRYRKMAHKGQRRVEKKTGNIMFFSQHFSSLVAHQKKEQVIQEVRAAKAISSEHNALFFFLNLPYCIH